MYIFSPSCTGKTTFIRELRNWESLWVVCHRTKDDGTAIFVDADTIPEFVDYYERWKEWCKFSARPKFSTEWPDREKYLNIAECAVLDRYRDRFVLGAEALGTATAVVIVDQSTFDNRRQQRGRAPESIYNWVDNFGHLPRFLSFEHLFAVTAFLTLDSSDCASFGDTVLRHHLALRYNDL